MNTKKILTAIACLCMASSVCGYMPTFSANATAVEEVVQTQIYDIFMYKNLGNYIEITAVSKTVSGKIEVPAEIDGLPVQVIGEHAFASTPSITEIVLPKTVKSINKQAFTQCTSLEKINIPESVKQIKDEAFLSCKALKEIKLPNYTSSIGVRAFWGCTALEKINIPSTVKTIGEQAFQDCKCLVTIDIPDGITTIEANTFNGCDSLESINVPASVTSIGMNAFSKSLQKLTIHNPDCELHVFAVNPANTTIKALSGSKVHTFAIEHNIDFQAFTGVILEEDVNADEEFNIADIVALNNWLQGRGSIGAGSGDLNHDGTVDIFDLCLMRKEFAKSLSSSPEVVNLTENVVSGEISGKTADSQLISSQTDFAVKLLKETVTEPENVLISPYSVMQALAMTANGADGKTLEEMEQTLGGVALDTLNEYLYTLRINQPDDEKCKLLTANSVWSRDTDKLSVNADFLQKTVDYYDADIFRAPFDDSTVKSINNWISQKTEGMIKEVIQKIGDNTMMYLINAVTFDAEWQKKYEEDNIRDANFTTADGKKQTAEMMYSTEYTYISGENETGFMKNYSGARYAFAAILPDKDIPIVEYVQNLTPETLHTLLSETKNTPVNAGLPKFNYGYNKELKESLSNMGMPTAFTDSADFSGISNISLMLDSVIHQTFINVDASGTEAGAVTIVIAAPTSVAPQSKQEVILDRPFVYCIVDTETTLPVFIGTLTTLE
ncbi:MAG: leucine-rich repeat protein [Prevotella sp.]|nr:leucine-rich repeat protein [Alistipes senegalensis]MCM1357125.1 leucine-rich repeat protein [Prevotella sp.]MCM1472637.1 leucine-rich repeat protein [Muribaculaceae bacterium]